MFYRTKSRVNKLIRKLPIVNSYFMKMRFKVELDVIEGKHHTENTHPSIIHFSVNKAATQYIKSVFNRCAKENGMTSVDIHHYAFLSNFPYLDKLSADQMQKYQHIFKPVGYFYGVFGGMIETIPNLEKYKVVLVVRDPRDLLVSSYYSTAYSHREPDEKSNKYENFMEKRQTARQNTIDEYVIAESDQVYSVYQRYIENLLNQYSNAYLTRYEEMTADFQTWLQNLMEYCELEISHQLLNSLLEEQQLLKPKKEDIYQHIRKGQPGEYAKKLKPETVDFLNSKFAAILKRLNYVET